MEACRPFGPRIHLEFNGLALAGGAPGSPAPFVGMCHIYCETVEAFQRGFGPHAKEIMADVPNYTDVAPQVQISEVVVG